MAKKSTRKKKTDIQQPKITDWVEPPLGIQM